MKVPVAPLFVVAVVALIGLSLSAPATVGQAPAPVRARWEYLTRHVDERASFNADGDQGWELVAVVRHSAEPASVLAYFKRRLP